MNRLIRKTVILACLELATGVDAAPTGAINALQVSNLSITPLDAKNVDLAYIRPYFGNSESLVGTASVKCSFTVSLAGSGDAAIAPAWAPLLVACANAEVAGLAAPARTEFLPCTDLLQTLTIYWYDDGLLHKLLGCFGNVKLSAKSGEAPHLTFDFVGVDGGVAATANAQAVLTNWKTPAPITRANVTDITLGCGYADGALVGGVKTNSTGLTLDWGNAVAFVPMLSTEAVVLTDRKMKGTMSLQLSAAQEAGFMAMVKANTSQGVGFVIGNQPGNTILLHMPAVQLTTPKKEDTSGMRMIGFDMNVLPVLGNDELRIVCL